MAEEEYIKRIIKVLIFIEENIDGDLSLEKLAKVACYSPFHFHRIFLAIVGETLHDYIKRLRMQAAAGQLRYSKRPVTEIALDANFETPSAFTKAFRQYMGMAPRGYRSLHTAAKILTKKMKELPMIKPDKIESIPDLELLFARSHGDYAGSAPHEAWQMMNDFIDGNQIDRSDLRYFGLFYDDPEHTSNEKVRYDAAIWTYGNSVPSRGIEKRTLKGGKYAIFTHKGSHDGPNGLADTFNRILFKWLPESNENFDEARPDFCEYFNFEYVTKEPEKLMTKIYIPLK